jgi:hypothetical protein
MLKTTTVRPLMTRTGSALGNVWRKSAILAQVAAFVLISHCSNDGLAWGYRVQYSLRRVGLMILMCRHYVYTCVRCQQVPFLRGQAGTSSGSAASMRLLHPLGRLGGRVLTGTDIQRESTKKNHMDMEVQIHGAA